MLKIYLLHMITFLYCGVCSSETQKPKLKQLHFIEQKDGLLFGYSCRTRGYTGDYLSWYQIKGPEHVLLRTVQRTDKGSGEIEVTANINLQETDYGTQIYCAKYKELREGVITDVIESDSVPITFNKNKVIKQEKPYVNINPNKTLLYFDVNETHTLSCSGSKPVEGRELTWYIQAHDETLKYANNQTYYPESNINLLKLHLDESYYKKRLYCVQAFLQKFLNNGILAYKSYNDLARSDIIQLRLNGQPDDTHKDSEDPGKEGDSNETDDGNVDSDKQIGEDKFKPLPLVITLAVIVVITSVVAAMWLLRRRRQNDPTQEPEKTQETQEHEEDLYATAQVTYAELQFKRPDEEYASSPAQDSCQYTQIVAVLKPKRR